MGMRILFLCFLLGMATLDALPIVCAEWSSAELKHRAQFAYEESVSWRNYIHFHKAEYTPRGTQLYERTMKNWMHVAEEAYDCLRQLHSQSPLGDFTCASLNDSLRIPHCQILVV